MFNLRNLKNDEEVKDDMLFNISATTEVAKEELVIELTSDGHLVAIEDIVNDDIPSKGISTEDITNPTFPQLNAPVAVPNDKDDGRGECKEHKIAPTLFLKSLTNVTAYLYDNCEESVDTLIHILMQADDKVNVSISICSPLVSVYTIIELTSAIEATEAKVKLNLVDIQSAIALLLLIPKYEELSIGTGLVISPIKDMFYGPTDNIRYELNAIESYNDMVYDALKDNNILSEEECVRLTKKADIIYISGPELLGRVKQ